MHRRIATALLAAALTAGPALVASGVAAPAALAAANPYQRGPDPTTTAALARNGTFATATTTVSKTTARTFGGGTIYYPTATNEGTFGAVAIAPGFTESQSAVRWLGPRLASYGFVVITIDTLGRYDQPSARGDQLLAALDYLTTSSSVKTRIDPTRLAVMGHSMGGGGTLEAAKDRRSLQAAIPLAGYDTDASWPEIVTPTLLVGAQNDNVAPVARHSEPFYQSIPATTPKAYVELAGASHSATNSDNATTSWTSVAWLKRFVDDDLRYQRFLCPAPAATGPISEYRTTCTW